MHDDPAHVDVRTARLAAAFGAVAWVVIGLFLHTRIGPLALVGLPLTALWSITLVEATRRLRLT